MFEKMYFVTNHAIERYKERVSDIYTSVIIRKMLESMQDARVIKRTYRSGEIYHCRVNGCDIFPIVYPPDHAKGGWPVIITIITAETQEGGELLRRAKKLWK